MGWGGFFNADVDQQLVWQSKVKVVRCKLFLSTKKNRTEPSHHVQVPVKVKCLCHLSNKMQLCRWRSIEKLLKCQKNYWMIFCSPWKPFQCPLLLMVWCAWESERGEWKERESERGAWRQREWERERERERGDWRERESELTFQRYRFVAKKVKDPNLLKFRDKGKEEDEPIGEMEDATNLLLGRSNNLFLTSHPFWNFSFGQQ